MKSLKTSIESIEAELLRVWRCLGLPFSQVPAEEAEVGLIDPEATLLLTLVFARDSRVLTDVPAWLVRYSDLLNHGKIRSLLALLPSGLQGRAAAKMREGLFVACPPLVKKAFGIKKRPGHEAVRTIRSRAGKIRPAAALAASCRMIHNRLYFGTGFRADLVSVIQSTAFALRVKQVAGLIGCAESTASRILRDLQACGFLDPHNQPREQREPARGLFISAVSLSNLSGLAEAAQFESASLQQHAIEELDLRFDGLTRSVLASGG